MIKDTPEGAGALKGAALEMHYTTLLRELSQQKQFLGRFLPCAKTKYKTLHNSGGSDSENVVFLDAKPAGIK